MRTTLRVLRAARGASARLPQMHQTTGDLSRRSYLPSPQPPPPPDPTSRMLRPQ